MKSTNIQDPEYFHKVVDCQYACPSHTPVPEYIRLIRTLFGESLDRLHRDKADSLNTALSGGDAGALRHLFQGNDFLRTDEVRGRFAAIEMGMHDLLASARRGPVGEPAL